MRHAGWLLTRYRVRPEGRTSYQLLHRDDYRGEVLIVGELCWVLDPRPEIAALKGDSRWSQGLWLGKVEASDEHIVGLGGTVAKKGKRPAAARAPLSANVARAENRGQQGPRLAFRL